MNKSIWIWVGVLAVVVAGGGYYWWYSHNQSAPAAAAAPPPAAAPAPPPQHYTVDQTPAPDAKPLPKLEDSDAAAQESLSALFGVKLAEFFNLKDIVRRFVATVDNLPREHVANRLLFFKPVPGHFAGGSSISPDNYGRYDAYVQLVQAVDTKQLVSAYIYFYPLFQQAYVGLGYPDGYFNDRLVAVIDHLLAAPEPAQPVALNQPGGVYTYADPELEALSAGQKMMVRMGAKHEATVKDKLRQVRAELVSRAPQK